MTIKVEIKNLDNENLYIDIAGENRTIKVESHGTEAIYVYHGHELTLRTDARQRSHRRSNNERRFRR